MKRVLGFFYNYVKLKLLDLFGADSRESLIFCGDDFITFRRIHLFSKQLSIKNINLTLLFVY